VKVRETAIPGLLSIEPKVFEDQRGFFLESWQQKRYQEVGVSYPFVQDNVSRSKKGVLRGLHFQNPNPQGKLVYVLSGEVFDVIVDIRKGSPTFGEWFGTTLSEENKKQLFVPPGCAHGFCVTSDSALFAYKCSDYYSPESEKTLLWNDPDIKIEWPMVDPVITEKDQKGIALNALPDSWLMVYS